MRSPLIQILDTIVKLNAHDTRKVRDMADAHLRDLGPEPVPVDLKLGPFDEYGAVIRDWAAVYRKRERLDGPDDDYEEPAGQVGHTDDF